LARQVAKHEAKLFFPLLTLEGVNLHVSAITHLWGGKPVRRLQLPRDASLVTILRGPRVIVPAADEPLEGGDELLFVAVTEVEEELRQLLLPAH